MNPVLRNRLPVLLASATFAALAAAPLAALAHRPWLLPSATVVGS